MPTRRKLGIGVVGAGGISRDCHLPSLSKLQTQCRVIAVADVDAVAAGEAAERFGVPRVYSNHAELLRDADIDAVVVATPNYEHLAPTVAALEAGKHVFCEKPLGRNAAEARKMVRAAQKADRILQVGLQWRFTGVAQYVERLAKAGRLGEVYYARCRALRRRGIPGWGVFTDKEKQGGGPMIDIGVHILDLTLFLMGYPEPVSASGFAVAKFGNRRDVIGLMGSWDYKTFTVEDFAAGFVRFKNGAVVAIESSFCANIKRDVFSTELLGTNAGAFLQPMDEPNVEIYGEADRALFDQVPAYLPKTSAYEAEIVAFVEAIRKGQSSPVPGEQGLILNAIIDAIYKSSETGKEEPIDIKC